MPVACSWLLSLWPALTQRCSSMMCAASRCRGNTVVPGASLTASCSRANWPGPPATGPPCWTCVRGRYEPELLRQSFLGKVRCHQCRHPDVSQACAHVATVTAVFLLHRRSWCPRWRRCDRRSSRASTCPALLLLPLLFHLLPSCPLPWCPLSTPCLLSTHLAPWAACPLIITRIIHITPPSTDPEPFQVQRHLLSSAVSQFHTAN